MTTIAQTKTNKTNLIAACAQQQRLLQRFQSVSHYLGGLVACMWLPGRNNTFDNPVRWINDRSKKKEPVSRPVFLVLEVTDRGDLNLSGSISRLKRDSLTFSPIFSYDISMPYTPQGGGRVLSANNIVLSRRANELLSKLVNYGRDVAFGVQQPLPTVVFPEINCDDRGALFEDYSPVLGLSLRNPARDVTTVTVKFSNPAAKVLARHGLDTIAACDAHTLQQLVDEFRAELSWTSFAKYRDVHDVPDEAVKLAFERHENSFSIELPLSEAVVVDPDAAAYALRMALPYKYQKDATFSDLMLAAKHPESDLKISRLSAIQICNVESVQDLPDGYAGTVLAPVDWAPATSIFNFAADKSN